MNDFLRHVDRCLQLSFKSLDTSANFQILSYIHVKHETQSEYRTITFIYYVYRILQSVHWPILVLIFDLVSAVLEQFFSLLLKFLQLCYRHLFALLAFAAPRAACAAIDRLKIQTKSVKFKETSSLAKNCRWKWSETIDIVVVSRVRNTVFEKNVFSNLSWYFRSWSDPRVCWQYTDQLYTVLFSF